MNEYRITPEVRKQIDRNSADLLLYRRNSDPKFVDWDTKKSDHINDYLSDIKPYLEYKLSKLEDYDQSVIFFDNPKGLGFKEGIFLALKEAMSLKTDYPVLYFHDSVHSEALFVDKKNKRVFFCRDSAYEALLSDMQNYEYKFIFPKNAENKYSIQSTEPACHYIAYETIYKYLSNIQFKKNVIDRYDQSGVHKIPEIAIVGHSTKFAIDQGCPGGGSFVFKYINNNQVAKKHQLFREEVLNFRKNYDLFSSKKDKKNMELIGYDLIARYKKDLPLIEKNGIVYFQNEKRMEVSPLADHNFVLKLLNSKTKPSSEIASNFKI